MSGRTEFPNSLTGPLVWDSADYQDKPELYVECLSKDDVANLKKATAHFRDLKTPRGSISKETFPLPDDLACRLQRITSELNYGRGFQKIRGLEPWNYSEEDNVIIFTGIASYVASHRAGFVDHICYEKKQEAKGENLRPTELPVAMGFHTDADAGNILSMYSQSFGSSGGNQYLSSFWTVYNDLLKNKPEVLETLSKIWHWEKPNKKDGARTNYIMRRPIIACDAGRPQINFGSSFVAGHPKYPLSKEAPGLDDSQKEALDALKESAIKHSFCLDQQPGDIIFINNLGILHARDAFVDGASADTQRHLIRLWLNDREVGWPIAEALQYNHGQLYNMPAEKQNLMTFSEAKAMPRELKVTLSGTSESHD